MKKSLKLLLIMMSLFVLCMGKAYANSLRVDKSKIRVGDEATAVVDYSDSFLIPSVKWINKSSNISITSNGRKSATIVGLNPGTACFDVNLVYVEATEVFSYCIKVFGNGVDNIDLTGPTSIKYGETVQLRAVPYLNGSEVSGSEIEWSSSNPDIINVDRDGFITGRNVGKATITVNIDGLDESIEILVLPVEISKITFSKTSVTMDIGSTLYVPVTIDPSVTSTSRALTWTSSDPSVAKVDSDGQITAIGMGTAKITARSVNNIEATLDVVVKKNIKDVTIPNISNQPYTGNYARISLEIKDGSKLLVQDKDYKFTYINHKEIGTATVNIIGMGDYSGTISKNYNIVVSIPRNMKVSSQTDTSIRINWTKPNALLTGYEVYYSDYDSGEYKFVYRTKKSTDTTYLKKNMGSGKMGYFKVRSYYEKNGKTYYSNFVSINGTTTPARPIMLNDTTSAMNSIKVGWKKVPEANGYVLSRSTSKEGPYVKVATFTSGNAVSYTDKGLDAATTYYYKVVAYKENNGEKIYGYYAQPVCTSTNPRVATLTVKGDKTSATLSWTRLRGITGYEVYYATSKTGKYSKLKTIATNTTTSFKKTGLSANSNYYFKVRAYRIVDGKRYYSDFSNVAYRLK